MELKLDKHEVEGILLAWAENHWPSMFNKITIEARYNELQSVEFSQKTDKPEGKDE